MLRDVADKYYFDGNFNCAETLIHAANEYYGLDVNERDMILVSGFGAGIQTGNLCGAVLASVSALSMKYVAAKAHESEDIKPVTTKLLNRFREVYGESLLCDDVKPKFFVEGVRCHETVMLACDVLEQVITEYESEKNESKA